MPRYLESAFNAVCKSAVQAGVWYVILVEQSSFYGGPEEGGWWGQDSDLVAFQICPSEEEAERLLESVKVFAAELEAESEKEYGEQCLREMDWLESHDLEADFLVESDGPSSYHAYVAESLPEPARGCRQYS